jgi:hypothetical protein
MILPNAAKLGEVRQDFVDCASWFVNWLPYEAEADVPYCEEPRKTAELEPQKVAA